METNKMKNKKLLAVTASVVLLGAIGVGSTLAYFTDTEQASNVVTMGHVDIELTEPQFSEANTDNTIENVVPNQEITKDPTITVGEDSEDCYVRVYLEITELDADQQAALLENINIDDSKWVLGDDGYYYYQDVLSKGDEVEFFTTVTIPEDWGNEVADMTFEINVSAEAIQSDYFEPETNSSDQIVGWNGVTAESYENSGN
jgi:predicted ribosomally synthesized peptide with SipW-like signal peptide